MSDLFYNPYQFIPVDTDRSKELTEYKHSKSDEAVGLSATENNFVRHDYWHEKGLSGCIRCTLKAKTPLVVGAAQIPGNKDANQPGEVVPYMIPLFNRLDDEDRDKQYAIPGNSLRGMVSSIAETISQSSLRVLHSKGEGDYSIRKPGDKPLKKIGLLIKESEGYFIYPLASTQGDGIKKVPMHNALIKNNDTYQHANNPQRVDYNGAQGILYIRGKVTKESNKQKEFFIPWDGEVEINKCIPVSDDVVSSFDRVLKARYEAYQKENKHNPNCFEESKLWPKGYNDSARKPDPNDESKPLVLPGDIVYYDGTSQAVSELSYSAIWRKVVSGDIYQSFEAHAGINATPWHSGRTHLTPAEAIFGVVEDQPDKNSGARNLASRVRFGDATSETPLVPEPAVVLKALSSPKPPSPAMYFSAKGGKYIAKEDLDLRSHSPNGRKYYIPHADGAQDWIHDKTQDTDRDHMRLRCQPIPSGSHFSVDIHFENLSQAELGLLRTALQPAGEGKDFIHRLGLGKPLGLGQVTIESAEVSKLDRQARYSLKRFTQDSPYQAYTEAPDLSLVDEEQALPSLLALADSRNYEDLPICYPYDRASNKSPHQSAHNEKDGFQWFVENDSKYGRNDFLHSKNNASSVEKLNKVMKPLSSTKQRNKG